MNGEDDDGGVFVSFGVILSLPYRSVKGVREALKRFQEVKFVYQTVSADNLILLKERSARRILAGDLEELREVVDKKRKAR